MGGFPPEIFDQAWLPQQCFLSTNVFFIAKHDCKVKRGNWLKKILALRSEIRAILGGFGLLGSDGGDLREKRI
ncbi:MAG: hypothetical protein ACTSRK_18240 [Promethearchaeota archaeon]